MTTKAPGSASSRNTSCTRTAVRSASRPRVIPAPQGPYYTGVGYSNVGAVAREIVEKHLDLCLAAGINHEGINAEVAKGQWEFQIFGKGSKKAADEMWMARYLLQRLTETYGIDIEYHCKPLGDTDWNGSGMHANFSTTYMREIGGKAYFEALMAAFEKNLMDHIAVYGPDNDKRLTGKHETAPWNKFSYGVADRGASIRVPHSFIKNDYKGYLEDRRPNSQGDPYAIASQILKTDRRSSDRRQVGCGLSRSHTRAGAPGTATLIRQSDTALADHCVLMTVVCDGGFGELIQIPRFKPVPLRYEPR